jgi:hypothetical protein
MRIRVELDPQVANFVRALAPEPRKHLREALHGLEQEKGDLKHEIQGLLAHEFSHILNGDMRLNLRLIGWLHAAYDFRHDDDRPAADVA